ncbi:MAG: outer membrane protein assembly factor [Chitinophagales bacterium]|nr:outer membrane protein assembly factor [Chitinophagales bacterium]
MKVVLLFATLLFSSWSYAQEETQDSLQIDIIAAQQVQEDTVPPKRTFIDKVFNQEKSVTGLVFPLAYYTPEYNLMLGLGAVVSWRAKRDTANTPSYTSAWGTYSIDNQVRVEVFGSYYAKSDKHRLTYEVNYQKLKQPFFGIGNKLPKSDKELALTKGFSADADYLYQIHRLFLIGGSYGFDYTTSIRPEPNKMLDTGRYIGANGGFVQGIGINLAFDNRDDLYFAYKGNYLGLEAKIYPKALGSKYQFATLGAEYRSFINIKRKVILASQITAKMSFGDVPFYLLPALGGKELLRGYSVGSSRDYYLFNLQGELRIPVNRFIFTGFFGSGITGPQFMDYFKVKDYAYSIGGGIRFRPFLDKNIVARLDVGFWKGTYGVYFVFNEAF